MQQQKSNDELLNDSAQRVVEDISKLMNNELNMARQDFKFYTAVNNEASKKVEKISDIVASNSKSVELIEQSYNELEEYRKYVDQLETTLDGIELTVGQLDEQTKMIEASFRAIERKLAQQALKK
ncbi:hypothetical protein EHI8A_188960 [Entamoeba histolytica HM-1:IMSS-B]|uniref:Biogenesis of lysosome-related organelles complex 1 subunit 2 n=6 Tax=Entamoeba histolytica TaxID=5759 RepID=B1N3N4_ENTH1|nr:hypothetical protein EHI_097910 [Entamoeba histolytica HM-1:IMSS]EMD48781.1 Hypothetical protein EHI5A_029070 [Entamoeba histolytica KU27]EMH76973.1 hypothetical protein EHI8A_188960 [Entamoeba histolytica HM-1:IMSS-B]EMS10992.1 hypothetical protein KM1_030630 [Entamoeba histolytica HM-3:IMSS]ENY62939.1 hypothetical protein EHI7A_013400 [Entamoeba histolytica HM-1:IMSS-A]GAT96173.1 hypothetical protein CL6EHI_097910 [Entamoeba histolytica]|eukprot:XP_001913800.1 hypothetical protein EHI_097910 [Entamoeba histolytica HM-1:IMSS]